MAGDGGRDAGGAAGGGAGLKRGRGAGNGFVSQFSQQGFEVGELFGGAAVLAFRLGLVARQQSKTVGLWGAERLPCGAPGAGGAGGVGTMAGAVLGKPRATWDYCPLL